MVVRVGIAIVFVAVAAAIAALINRRPRSGPPVRDAAKIPRQLDRADFPRPDAPYLVVVFSSGTCDGCRPMAEKVAVLEGPAVATVEVEFAAERALHDRYEIDSVPLVLVADAEGVVRRSFLGAASATDLWAAVAELRAPGSSPEPELGRDT